MAPKGLECLGSPFASTTGQYLSPRLGACAALYVADFAGSHEIPHGTRNAHAAEVRTAHAAEVACLRLAAGERLVVEFHRLLGVER